jgi:putative tryptophan/tyrosine transport system substrate-binding protein
VKRREFIRLIRGAALAWPLAARAQQAAVPVVAFIHGGAAETMAPYAAGFRKGLSEAGYAEGQNVIVEYHWLEGHYERLPAVAADLVRRRVSVIATPGSTEASRAAKAATATIPIVFGVPADPVTLGLVASLARPGGNATGINFFSLEINAKRLGIIHELLPKARCFAVLLNPAARADAEATSKALDEAARAFGVDIAFQNASTRDAIDTAFAGFAREKPDALFIAADSFFAGRAVQLAMLSMRERLPASFTTRPMVQAGLLMSYGVDIIDTFRQVGVYTGTILKGARPADLPVQQSTKLQLVFNLQTAKALGLEIPPMLLARADEVIE